MTYDNTEKERQNEAYTVDLREQDQEEEEEKQDEQSFVEGDAVEVEEDDAEEI